MSVSQKDLLESITRVVSSYVGNHAVPIERLDEVIDKIGTVLERRWGGGVSGPRPAVPISESVHPDYLVCLEDGEKVTLLRRYLQNHHNMTPEQYIAKWGLPEDYPFVARSYSQKRSRIAKEHGLGKGE